jgi:modified peptide precursor CbpA
MTKRKGIISYRRRCRAVGNGTGLSHYILVTPKKADNK